MRTAKAGGTTVRKASTQSLEAFGAEYRQKYALVELAPSTLAVQKSVWNNHVLPRLGAHSLTTLASEPELIQGFKADLLADGVGEAAVRKTLAVLGAVLQKAVEWNRIPSNPVATVKKPSAKRKRRIQPMPTELVERLIASLPSERDRRLVSVLAYAGLRPGEALALEGRDVALRTITVDKAISLGEVGQTKTKVDRVVPLLPVLRKTLGTHGPGLLFPREDGEPWRDHDYRNWRRRVFQPAVKALGEDWAAFRPYDLRHSFASLLLSNGHNPIEVAEIMGHSPQVLFSTYAHVIGEVRAQNVPQFGAQAQQTA